MENSEFNALLADYISAPLMTHTSLTEKQTKQEFIGNYGLRPGDRPYLAQWDDGTLLELSYTRVEQALQSVVQTLDQQGAAAIVVLAVGEFSSLHAGHATLLVADRIIPPLIAPVVGDHRAGILFPHSEFMPDRQQKWQCLKIPPLYASAAPLDDNATLIAAGDALRQRGAEVLVLDGPEYAKRHRDMLHQTLEMPVIMSHILLARLASDLVA
ncbi:AroM family protein [Apirhabdus apintestini]|nr:AroM family protein [Enterobacteriaceae bacterium CA-0114]